jgi:hypothetical protein
MRRQRAHQGPAHRARFARRSTVAVVIAAVALVATSCYQDFDFDADHKADLVSFDMQGDWTMHGTGTVIHDGTPEDWPVPGDWNGDHFADIAVVKPDGRWITQTSRGTITFPPPPDLPAYAAHPSLRMLPVPLDHDGDGDLEPAWYRESDGTWFIEGLAPIDFGEGPKALPGAGDTISEDGYDFPVPADYDGDGRDDLGVYDPVTGDWAVRDTATGVVSTVSLPGNQLLPFPVAADFDGVGHAQRAVFGDEGWFIEGHAEPDPYGAAVPGVSETGFPAAADYDGDNRADLSYIGWHSETWHIQGQASTVQLDLNDDWPLMTGANLRANVARLTHLGQCVVLASYC